MERTGHYILERELGRGGMGVVYVARHELLGRRVALKVQLELGDDELARFQREALSLARLKHPNVVTIHQVGTEGGRPWLAMDLVEGQALDARIARDGPLEA